MRLPRAARLTKSVEFRRVRREGRSWPGRHVTLAVLFDAETGMSRIGIITTRQIGGAVVRNRVRRRLRDIVRLTRQRLKVGCWIVLLAKRSAASVTSDRLRDDWEQLAQRAGIWRGVA